MIDLSTYSSIESAIFIKWTVPNQTVRYLSDYHTDVTIDGNVYTNQGTLLGMSSTQSEIKASPAELNIGLSGLSLNAIADIRSQQIKGSTIEIYRGFFDASTHALINLTPSDNPVLKFKGIVTNYSITDDVTVTDNAGTSLINLSCNSFVEVLAKKLSGRRTNKVDFSGESSMDRVQVLSKSNINFGAPS